MNHIRVPKVGMSAIDVEILEILVSPGQAVDAGDPVAEVGADKVDFTIEADHAGTVLEVLVKVGDTCPVGAVVVSLSDDGTR
jgi:pyruvate/2-oxoglutarate dehydrogenase complex dihydrolipoamide acyltransferase (E2) component